jgi:hypothetical protein
MANEICVRAGSIAQLERCEAPLDDAAKAASSKAPLTPEIFFDTRDENIRFDLSDGRGAGGATAVALCRGNSPARRLFVHEFAQRSKALLELARQRRRLGARQPSDQHVAAPAMRP